MNAVNDTCELTEAELDLVAGGAPTGASYGWWDQTPTSRLAFMARHGWKIATLLIKYCRKWSISRKAAARKGGGFFVGWRRGEFPHGPGSAGGRPPSPTGKVMADLLADLAQAAHQCGEDIPSTLRASCSDPDPLPHDAINNLLDHVFLPPSPQVTRIPPATHMRSSAFWMSVDALVM